MEKSMIKDEKWENLKKLASFLFDGNEEKAEKLLVLMEEFSVPQIEAPVEFSNLKMRFPEETCRWCANGDCLIDMPDQILPCEGICKLYEGNLNRS